MNIGQVFLLQIEVEERHFNVINVSIGLNISGCPINDV